MLFVFWVGNIYQITQQIFEKQAFINPVNKSHFNLEMFADYINKKGCHLFDSPFIFYYSLLEVSKVGDDRTFRICSGEAKNSPGIYRIFFCITGRKSCNRI